MSEQDLTPDQLEQLREQLASVPAGEVVAEAAVPLITMAQIRLGLPPWQRHRQNRWAPSAPSPNREEA